MAAPPRSKFLTMAAVTEAGYALTPSATTPWSAQKRYMPLRGRGGVIWPVRRQ